MTESIAPTPTEQFLSKYRIANRERNQAYDELKNHLAGFVGHTVAISGYPFRLIMTSYGKSDGTDRNITKIFTGLGSLFADTKQPQSYEPAIVTSLQDSTMSLEFPYDVPPLDFEQYTFTTGCIMPVTGILSIIDIETSTKL